MMLAVRGTKMANYGTANRAEKAGVLAFVELGNDQLRATA
jgi:hypothetical protein